MGEALGQKSIARLDKDLLQELEVSFMEISERKGFPDSFCTKISKELSDHLGLKYQEGVFTLDFPNGKGNILPTHAWCKDADGVIVDMTAHQYNDNLINKLPESVQIVYPNNPLYKKYVPLEEMRK